MDLPTCPACKQSVLDEEAVECPFCGAPMKGGASAARPGSAAKPPAAKSPAAKSGPTKTGSSPDIAPRPSAGRGRPEKTDEEPAAPAADDDPFAIDPSVAASAIPVSRQPGPGKPLEVVCPMCETKGFVSLKAAGKQVKCCNPQCMVPIFAAPALEKKEVVAPPPPPKKNIPWLYVGGGIAAVAIAGYCIWVMQDPGLQELPPTITELKTAPPAALGQTEGGNKIGPPGDKANQVVVPQDKEKARQEIIRQALVRMLEVSPKIENQRKHSWRRLAITAYLYAGNDKETREQLDLIKKQQSPYEGVLPVVALAWHGADRADEFKRAVADAQALAEKLPARGRYASEAAVATAPLLVVSGKVNDARQLLHKHHTEPLVEQVAAALRVVIEDESFDLDTTLVGRTIGDWQKPMETAVTLILAAHGRWDDALAWSSQSEDSVAKTEGIMAWAESYARQAVPAEDASGWERAAGAGKDLTAENQARLLARLAAVKLSKGDRAGAEELIAQAEKALKTLPPPKSISIKTIKEVYDLKLQASATVPLWQSALAATEIAGVQARLGNTQPAWASVQTGLQFLRAIGPSLSAMHERRAQLDKNQNGVQNELAKELGLKKEDDKRSALKRYKERFRDCENAAVTRFSGQATVLKAAATFGLLDQVWEELQAIDRRPLQEREPLLSTALPLFVAARFEEAGNHKRNVEITDVVQPRVDPSDPQVVEQSIEQHFKAGDLPGCIDQLNATMNPHGTLHEFALRVACRLVNQGRIADAISFCSRIKDQAIREDALYLTAALAARTGKGDEYWKSASGLAPMETTAVCSGLVIGFHSKQPAVK